MQVWQKTVSQPHCSEEKATLKTKSVGKIPEQHFSSQTYILEKLSLVQVDVNAQEGQL